MKEPSVTNILNSLAKISASDGLPAGTVTASASASAGQSVTTTMSTSKSYMQQQYSGTTRTQDISQELTLIGGLTWNVLLWGAIVDAYGNYDTQYYKYLPGSSKTTTSWNKL